VNGDNLFSCRLKVPI